MKLLYFDQDIIVVDKPGGLLAVPGRGPDKQDCVTNRVRALFPDCPEYPAVHRLDMHTSGVMVLARTKQALREISKQFERRAPEKIYIALVDGVVTGRSGKIELKFRLDVANRPLQIHDPVNGKLGITLWRKMTVEKGRSRIEFTPLTGRTHQLRLHAAHRLGLNAPIVGDALYGKCREGEKMLLHAASLSLVHPTTGTPLCFQSVVPF